VVFESHAHLVSQYEVVYASDCPARMSDNRIQLFRTQHIFGSDEAADAFYSLCGLADTCNREAALQCMLY
jgi:hypothetical protein